MPCRGGRCGVAPSRLLPSLPFQMDPVQKAVISHTFGVPAPLKKKQFISCNICHLRFNSAVSGAGERTGLGGRAGCTEPGPAAEQEHPKTGAPRRRPSRRRRLLGALPSLALRLPRLTFPPTSPCPWAQALLGLPRPLCHAGSFCSSSFCSGLFPAALVTVFALELLYQPVQFVSGPWELNIIFPSLASQSFGVAGRVFFPSLLF